MRAAVAIALLAICAACPVEAQNVTFDFDNGTPVLSSGQGTPFEQTSNGVTARFSSPALTGFSIQNDASTGWKLSKFSRYYLYANSLSRSILQIKFSRRVTSISLTFATADFEVEVPTPVRLAAFLDSTATPEMGSASARGAYSGDTMPMGTLSFDSAGRPFNLVEITIPFQPGGTSVFHVDNIVIAPAAGAATLSSVCAATYLSGMPLAPGSIVSGFGQGLASQTETATSQPLPDTLANTTLRVKDSAGVERRALLFYVGPGQINYLLPDATAAGPATIVVTSDGQVTATGGVDVAMVAPGLFTANLSGKGPPAAAAISVAPDLTQTDMPVIHCGTAVGSCVTSPINLGSVGTQVVLVLYGTGIRGRSSPGAVKAALGGIPAEVQYAGAQSQFAGLDQVNIVIPRAVTGRGDIDVVLTVDGKPANIVQVNIK